jgi:mannosylglycerate hydrolase
VREGRHRKLHLVINTHWDREWRWSFRETQRRLCDAMDLLLNTMEAQPEFRSFLADSQAAMVDDYLDARPEHRERIEKLVRDGRLFVGPWYTLPALFMVSGEAIVRNLLIGHEIATSLGGVMKAAYNVFSWGQISQLPQIYRQFGMDTILFYRGIDQSRMDRIEYAWEAPDGSRMLGLTFGEDHRLNFWANVYKPYRRGNHAAMFDRTGRRGYLLHHSAVDSAAVNHSVADQGNARDLKMALQGLHGMLDKLVPKSSTSHLLLLQGFDLENPDPEVPALVEALNGELDCDRIEISSIPDYFKAVRQELEAGGVIEKLPVYRGEMLAVERVGMGFGPLFAGVYSARMNIKLMNQASQARLVHWAEPASVWASLLEGEYPQRALRVAWKTLCQNQQHDGIGGCHVDRVTLTTLERYRTVDDIADDATRVALEHIVGRIDYAGLAEDEVGITVFNPHATAYTGVLECFVHIPLGEGGTAGGGYRMPGSLDVRDSEGRPVEAQVLEVEDQVVSALLRFGNVDKFSAMRFQVAIEVRDLPPMGYRCYTARYREGEYRAVERIDTKPNVLENEFLRVAIRGDGTIDMLDKHTGQEYRGLHYFEDGGEEGGPLMHITPDGEALYTTIGQSANVAKIRSGPLLAAYAVDREWALPAQVVSGLNIHIPNGPRFVEHGARARSEHKAVLRIRTEITLRKGVPFLEFTTHVDNRVRDHRLRAVFRTDVDTDRHQADAPFDVVSRPVAIPDSRDWYEAALRTWPTQSLVNVADGHGRGLAVLHAGLSEYEVFDDPTRSIALTLLRCFGTAGGGADTYSAQPLAQLQGEHVFRYALYPHHGRVGAAELLHAARHHSVPLRSVQCTAHVGDLPATERAFVELDSQDLVVSALKRSESGEGFVWRCYNPGANDVEASITVGRDVIAARRVDLSEREIEPLPAVGSRIPIHVAAGSIFSVEIVTAPAHSKNTLRQQK